MDVSILVMERVRRLDGCAAVPDGAPVMNGRES